MLYGTVEVRELERLTELKILVSFKPSTMRCVDIKNSGGEESEKIFQRRLKRIWGRARKKVVKWPEEIWRWRRVVEKGEDLLEIRVTEVFRKMVVWLPENFWMMKVWRCKWVRQVKVRGSLGLWDSGKELKTLRGTLL